MAERNNNGPSIPVPDPVFFGNGFGIEYFLIDQTGETRPVFDASGAVDDRGQPLITEWVEVPDSERYAIGSVRVSYPTSFENNGSFLLGVDLTTYPGYIGKPELND